jgi:hypothetical protein
MFSSIKMFIYSLPLLLTIMHESLEDFIKKIEGRLKGREHPQRIILTSDEARQFIDYAPRDGQTRRLRPVSGKEDQYFVSRRVALGALKNMYDSHKRKPSSGNSYAALFFLAASLFFASFSTTGYAIAGRGGAFDVKPLLSIVFLLVSLFMWAKK